MALVWETMNRDERQAWSARTTAALAGSEEVDDGDQAYRDAVVAGADSWRADHGTAPLGHWWDDKTEPRLHERARALGLLRHLR